MLLPAPSLACRFWLLNISCRRTRLPLPRLPPPRSSPHPLVAALARRCSCPPSHALAVAPARRRTRSPLLLPVVARARCRTRSLSHPLAIAPARHRTRLCTCSPSLLFAVAPARRRPARRRSRSSLLPLAKQTCFVANFYYRLIKFVKKQKIKGSEFGWLSF